MLDLNNGTVERRNEGSKKEGWNKEEIKKPNQKEREQEE